MDDIGRFLDCGFANQAAALDWGPEDLLGAVVTGRLLGLKAALLRQLNGERLIGFRRRVHGSGWGVKLASWRRRLRSSPNRAVASSMIAAILVGPGGTANR